MNGSTSAGESPVTLGILLVHGIGEQRRSDTLVNWLDTLVDTINRGTRRSVSATVEWAELAPEADDESTPQAIVRIKGGGVDERWVVVEGWWAEAFIAPSFSQLVGWSFRAVPWALAMHAAQGVHKSDDDTGGREQVVRRIGGVVRGIFLLLLAPFIVVLLAGLALIGLIPSETLRTSIGRFQRKLAATAGDSLVFLESPVRAAAMCSAVMSALARLERICSAAYCARRVVVAHSQGATVSLEALTRLARRSASAEPASDDGASTSGMIFITFGAGINKLGALRWLSTHSPADIPEDVHAEARKQERTRNDATVIERDPVLAACLGLLGMAGVGFWFWRLLGAGQLTVTELWAIPAVWLGSSLLVGALVELMKWLVERYGKRHPWLGKFAKGVVVAAFAGLVIGSIVAAERFDIPVMPFFLAVMLALILFVTLRLTFSKQLQVQIKETIARPSNVSDWRDFWATADPVPNGETRTSVPGCPTGTRIWNEGSVLRDHTTYWQNRDGFVLPVVRILARAAHSPWCEALPPEPKHDNVNQRSRWRVRWLRVTRWPVAVAMALAVLQRGEELERARGSAGDALSTVGIGESLGRIPHAWVQMSMLGAAALLSAWVAYLIVLTLWRTWVRAEQDALLDDDSLTGVTARLYVFGTAVMLLLAAAFYIGKTDWATFTADWQQTALDDAAILVAVIAIWGCVIVWLLAKWAPPPTVVNPRALTRTFNEHINNRDLNGLAALMTDDHTFIDTAGHATCGKSKCLEAWRGFFTSFPDYRNVFDSLVVDDDCVVVVGRSSCADVRLNGPAMWVAKVNGDRLAEWRVLEDTPTNRRTCGIASEGAS